MNYNSEKTTLHYIKHDSKNIPVIHYSGRNESQSYSDEYTLLESEVIDARSLKNKKNFSLDIEAFKLVRFKPAEVDFADSEMVKDYYYSSAEELVKKETGASHAFAFDHTVRRGIKNSNRHPAYHIHNDYTFETGKIRAEQALGEDLIKHFVGKRMIQVNVWRSITGVVEQDPLALMDATTLDKKDLIKTHIHFNDMHTGETHNGEIFALKKNENQRWYYFPEMHAEEAILIKGYDTDNTYACFAMHTAFPLAHQGPHNKPRESVETRIYAFYD